jgi:hypothetical protein
MDLNAMSFLATACEIQTCSEDAYYRKHAPQPAKRSLVPKRILLALIVTAAIGALAASGTG